MITIYTEGQKLITVFGRSSAIVTPGTSGGVELNFKVVGGETEPIDPAENTIWVNTPDEITGWGFGADADKPASPDTGMVWFVTSEDSHIKFDALKDDSIIVTPAKAYQYVSEAWKAIVTVNIYQNGKWVDFWDGYIYKDGNQYTDITGGWSADGYTANLTVAEATHESNYMVFNGKDRTHVLFGTQKPIDLTNASSVRFIGQVTGVTGSNGLSFSINRAKTVLNGIAGVNVSTVGSFDVRVPVDGITGECYIILITQASTKCKGIVTEVRVE